MTNKLRLPYELGTIRNAVNEAMLLAESLRDHTYTRDEYAQRNPLLGFLVDLDFFVALGFFVDLDILPYVPRHSNQSNGDVGLRDLDLNSCGKAASSKPTN